MAEWDRKEYRRKYYLAHKERMRQQGRDWYRKNRASKLAVGKAWRERNPERGRSNQLKRLYGLSLEAFDAILTAQSGLCKLCSCNLTKPVVEHDHKTKVVRGLVCQRCNIAIGHFENYSHMFRAIATYLEVPWT